MSGSKKLAAHDLWDEIARAHLADEVEGVYPVVVEKPPARPALSQRLPLPSPVPLHEVQRHPRAVVQAPSPCVHVGDDGGCPQKVLDGEASGGTCADQVHRVGVRTLQVAGYRRGVAEAAEKDPLCGRRVGYRTGAVGGHEDDVFVRDGLERVLAGEGAVVIAVYPLSALLAAAQNIRGVELSPRLLGLLQTRDGEDAAGAVLEDGQEGGRGQKDVQYDGGRANQPPRDDLLPGYQDPQPFHRLLDRGRCAQGRPHHTEFILAGSSGRAQPESPQASTFRRPVGTGLPRAVQPPPRRAPPPSGIAPTAQTRSPRRA